MVDKVVSQLYGGVGSLAPQVALNQEKLVSLSNPNLLLNGSFHVRQRTADSTNWAGVKKMTDMWSIANTGDTITATPSKTDARHEVASPYWGYIIPQTSDAVLYQRIEMFRELLGKTVTITFTAVNSNNNAPASIRGELRSNVGSGTWGSTPEVTKSFTALPVAPADAFGWRKYQVTTTFPAVSDGNGTPIPTDIGVVNPSYSVFLLYVGESDTTLFGITDVKIELGNTATPYQVPNIADETDKCQRYYEQMMVEWTQNGDTATQFIRETVSWCTTKCFLPHLSLTRTDGSPNTLWDVYNLQGGRSFGGYPTVNIVGGRWAANVFADADL